MRFLTLPRELTKRQWVIALLMALPPLAPSSAVADNSGPSVSVTTANQNTTDAKHPAGTPNPFGIAGGLIVQLGGDDVTAAATWSHTGRYLIHVLDNSSATTSEAQETLRRDGTYGLAWAETRPFDEPLPYTENLVNGLWIRADSGATPSVDLLNEAMRVLVPGGQLVVDAEAELTVTSAREVGFRSFAKTDAGWRATKPWPLQMDVWSHPRHASDGNAVSLDTMVGPPQRIRWVAAATSEVEGLVTAGGRNFYGGILSRDSFNGLRLWHRDLRRHGEVNTPDFSLPKLAREGSRPVASENRLFAIMKDRAYVLDAATGEVQSELQGVRNPTAMIHDGDRVIAADAGSIGSFDAETGQSQWRVEVSDPRQVISDGKHIALIAGQVRRGETAESIVLDAEKGDIRWRRDDYPWLTKTSRTVLAGGMLVFEVSSLNDHDKGNGIHVVNAATGEPRWSKDFPPGMNHARQARAMYLDGELWILHGGKINTGDTENRSRVATEISALDPATGKTRRTFPAGMAHCFPPVATPNYMFAGELDMTDLSTGQVIANRITKANCSRESGWTPANGLVYTTPKHCTCWPMLRGFVAMAPAVGDAKRSVDGPVETLEFPLISGPASAPVDVPQPEPDDWPLYRSDRWRSASSAGDGPQELKPRWKLALLAEDAAEKVPTGPIPFDWQDNPVVKGPLSAPTVAGGTAYVTRPDAHELIAIDTTSGAIRWRFTANGRLDTPPAIHRGICLFGSAAGWVYALRADTGEVIWRRRAAPSDERIVAYGQVESPWPVPGAVLVMDNVAYFAAGRQPLADGGILVFAVDPISGEKHWVRRIDSVPQKGFYENSGLEFDPFDILHAEGDQLAMSRWIVSRDGREVNVDKWNAFAKLDTGAGEVWIPRGSWTYGARHQHRFRGEAPRRPLAAFRDGNVYSSLNGSTDVFRRDFSATKGQPFNAKWITGWEAGRVAREGGKPYRSYRVAENAAWSKDPFAAPDAPPAEDPAYGTQLHNDIHAMAVAGNGRLYVVHRDGRMKVISTETGYVLTEREVPPPAWDGLAIAEGQLFLTTLTGEVVCLGD